MMISAAAIGQDETRTRPSTEDLRLRGTTYRVIEVSETDQYYNVYWKKWMLDDMKIFEEDNMLDMKRIQRIYQRDRGRTARGQEAASERRILVVPSA